MFSKIIFIGVSTAAAIVTAFTLVMVWKTGDTSALAYLIPAIFAELAAATGFYFEKAKKENVAGGIVYDTVMAKLNLDQSTGPIDPSEEESWR